MRYCSNDCQLRHWRRHKGACKDIAANVYDYRSMKDGEGLWYGPISGYDFQLGRHMAAMAPDVKLYTGFDFSVPHGVKHK